MRQIFLMTAWFVFGLIFVAMSFYPTDRKMRSKLIDINPARQSPVDSIMKQSGKVGSGVNIHFVKGHEKDLDMIAAGGFRFIRMDLLWEDTERSKGTYDWTAYDELTSNLEKRGLRAIYILCYSNPLYEDTVSFKETDSGRELKDIGSPQHAESIEAFARWSAAAAKHFRGKNIIWEIWNEPNVSYWRPVPDVSLYNALALATAKAVKEADPDARIIGPATSKIPMTFIGAFLASGILDYIDGVSVHPYRDYSLSPETAAREYDQLRKLIDRYAPAGKKDIPMISSEWGYASATKGVSVKKQAEYAVRMQLANLMNGIPLSIWYDWKNDGDNPDDFEHNCGTVTSALHPKPAYDALRTLNFQLKGFTFSKRIDLKNDNDYVLIFRNEKGETKISGWTTEPEHSVIIEYKVPAGVHATAIDGYGKTLKLKIQKNNLVPDLGALPQYITLPQGRGVK